MAHGSGVGSWLMGRLMAHACLRVGRLMAHGDLFGLRGDSGARGSVALKRGRLNLALTRLRGSNQNQATQRLVDL